MKAVIDRFEGNQAVLILQEDPSIKFNLPKFFLEECNEGDIVDISIKKDPETTKEARTRTSSLIEKLKKKSNQG